MYVHNILIIHNIKFQPNVCVYVWIARQIFKIKKNLSFGEFFSPNNYFLWIENVGFLLYKLWNKKVQFSHAINDTWHRVTLKGKLWKNQSWQKALIKYNKVHKHSCINYPRKIVEF